MFDRKQRKKIKKKTSFFIEIKYMKINQKSFDAEKFELPTFGVIGSILKWLYHPTYNYIIQFNLYLTVNQIFWHMEIRSKSGNYYIVIRIFVFLENLKTSIRWKWIKTKNICLQCSIISSIERKSYKRITKNVYEKYWIIFEHDQK